MAEVLIILLLVVLVLCGWVFYDSQYAEEKTSKKRSKPLKGKLSQSKPTKYKYAEPIKPTEIKQNKKDQKLDRSKKRGGKKSQVAQLESSDIVVETKLSENNNVQPSAITEQITQNEEKRSTLIVQNSQQRNEVRSVAKVVEQNPPKDVVYTFLKISDEHLVEAMVNQQSYYRKWEFKGKYYYDFFCDPTKIGKAINNKSVIVEPFCDKDTSSVPYDEAVSIETVSFGEIGSDNSIIKKAIIKYI